MGTTAMPTPHPATCWTSFSTQTPTQAPARPPLGPRAPVRTALEPRPAECLTAEPQPAECLTAERQPAEPLAVERRVVGQVCTHPVIDF